MPGTKLLSSYDVTNGIKWRRNLKAANRSNHHCYIHQLIRTKLSEIATLGPGQVIIRPETVEDDIKDMMTSSLSQMYSISLRSYLPAVINIFRAGYYH